MTYFPKFGPFYDPSVEREFYEEQGGHLRVKDPGLNSRHVGRTSGLERVRSPPDPQSGESGWTSLVQDQDLFYVETDHSTQRNRCRNNHIEKNSFSYDIHNRPEAVNGVSLYQEFKNSRLGILNSQHDHDDATGESDSAYGSGQNSRQTSREKRTARLHLDINRNNDFLPKQVTQNHHSSSYASNEFLNSEYRNSSKKRNSQSRSSGSYSYSPPVTSGKRKTFYMVPNLGNVSNVISLSGSDLCEKLFGIILCQYKHKPPKPNGSNLDQLLRDRKVIVQAVVPDSQAHLCGHIHRVSEKWCLAPSSFTSGPTCICMNLHRYIKDQRLHIVHKSHNSGNTKWQGDMLVGLNDIDVTWVNIDELFRAICSQQEVKLTFQVPQVIGPKQLTPPISPSCSTPPLPPPVPVRASNPSLRPPPRPPPAPAPSTPQDHGLIPVYSDQAAMSVSSLLHKYLLAVMYLTLTGSTEEPTEDVVYQFPEGNNKITDIRGLYLTVNGLMAEISDGSTKITTVQHRGNDINTCYWKDGKDLLVICLPADRVPDFYLQQILSDLLHNVNLLYGTSISRAFRNQSNHKQLDQLVSLTLQRILLRGVDSQSVPVTSPLEPALLDTLTGIRWLRLEHHNKILCDEILSEFEAADNTEQEDYDPDERRDYGILGSCLYYKDYLLCSHLVPQDLRDVHLFLKHHSILTLVNKQRVEELVIWREIYPTRLCHRQRQDKPGYREPSGRWFLLVVVMNHYIMCTILEAGSYSRPVVGNPGPDPFFVDQVKVTLLQLDADDADLEIACNERLFIEITGPALKCIGASKQSHKNSLSEESLSGASRLHVLSPTRSDPGPRNRQEDEIDRVSLNSPASDQPVMRRQGSKMSYGSNDSETSNSTGIMKGRPVSHIGSVSQMGSVADVTSLNRSFSRGDNSAIKLTRGVGNCLFHYVMFDVFEGVYVSPSRGDMASTQGSVHQHILYNFYSCCLRIHETFRKHRSNQSAATAVEGWDGVTEEGIMFTCQVDLEPRKPPQVLMYWVIGRLLPGDKEMYVCLEDGTPQSTLDLAFNFNFGLV